MGRFCVRQAFIMVHAWAKLISPLYPPSTYVLREDGPFRVRQAFIMVDTCFGPLKALIATHAASNTKREMSLRGRHIGTQIDDCKQDRTCHSTIIPVRDHDVDVHLVLQRVVPENLDRHIPAARAAHGVSEVSRKTTTKILDCTINRLAN
jgi:hypothetical protein